MAEDRSSYQWNQSNMSVIYIKSSYTTPLPPQLQLVKNILLQTLVDTQLQRVQLF